MAAVVRPVASLAAAFALVVSLAATPSALEAADQASGAAAPGLESQLQQVMERLERMEAQSETPAATASEAAEDETDARPVLRLPEWHTNLSESQRKLLMRTMVPAAFEPDEAPTPEECLSAFRSAAKASDDFETVLPFLALGKRRRYLLSEGHPQFAAEKKTAAEWLQPYRAFLDSVVQVDDVMQGQREDRAVLIVWTRSSSRKYVRYGIEYHGEGRLWRLSGLQRLGSADRLPGQSVTPESGFANGGQSRPTTGPSGGDDPFDPFAE